MKPVILKEMFIALCLFLLCISCYHFAKKRAFYHSYSPITLSETTTSLLSSFNHAINLTLYTQDEDKHRQIKILVEQYQAVQPNIKFDWLKKTTQSPSLPQHVLILTSDHAKEIIDLDKTAIDESALSNALFKLQRKPNQWVVFLHGHGEPSIYGHQMRDFNLFRQGLENQGLKIQELNIGQTPFIPDNTNVLVIGANQKPLMETEQNIVLDYLSKGKNLLWLIDPQSKPIVQLSELFGITPLEGTIVDLHGTKMGTPHPGIAIIEDFPKLPFVSPPTLAAFPFACALHSKSVPNFEVMPFLITDESSWTESDISNTRLSFDADKQEQKGPLTLGVILTNPKTSQRVIIIGNSRFINNGAIENYGNLALGLNLISWLNHDDELLDIKQPIVIDNMLYIPLGAALIIQYGFPVFCLLLFMCSMLMLFYRKKTSDKMAMIDRQRSSRIE